MFKLLLNLQLFAEETVPESPSVEGEETEETQETSGDEIASTPDEGQETTEEPTEDVIKQESFAKRLKEEKEKAIAEEREKWEQETSERYKDFDTYKKATEYLQKQSNIDDLMSLKEQLELTELQERADKEQVSPEVQKRLEDLEAKAARADELEQQQTEQQHVQTFQKTLEGFAKENEADMNELWTFMTEQQLPYDPDQPDKYFNIALKAMRADEVTAKLETAKKDAVKEYLESKQAPKAEGAATAGVSNDPPKTWEQSRQRAMDRMKAANTPT